MESCESLEKAAAGLPQSTLLFRNVMRDLVRCALNSAKMNGRDEQKKGYSSARHSKTGTACRAPTMELIARCGVIVLLGSGGFSRSPA